MKPMALESGLWLHRIYITSEDGRWKMKIEWKMFLGYLQITWGRDLITITTLPQRGLNPNHSSPRFHTVLLLIHVGTDQARDEVVNDEPGDARRRTRGT